MSRSYSANQYQSAFVPQRLQNWEVPMQHRENNWKNIQHSKTLFEQHPSTRQGQTVIVGTNRGHLLDGISRSERNPWGDFVGNWDLPTKIPGQHSISQMYYRVTADKRGRQKDRLKLQQQSRGGMSTKTKKDQDVDQYFAKSCTVDDDDVDDNDDDYDDMVDSSSQVNTRYNGSRPKPNKSCGNRSTPCEDDDCEACDPRSRPCLNPMAKSRPGMETSRPNNSTSRPSNSTSRPSNSTSRPSNSTSRPSNSTSRPSNSTSRPSNSRPRRSNSRVCRNKPRACGNRSTPCDDDCVTCDDTKCDDDDCFACDSSKTIGACNSKTKPCDDDDCFTCDEKPRLNEDKSVKFMPSREACANKNRLKVA